LPVHWSPTFEVIKLSHARLGPFVLTHHREDAVDGVTFLNCDVAEAVRLELQRRYPATVHVRHHPVAAR